MPERPDFDMLPLVKTVQHNCDLADAQYAGNYTLCIYLLKMREYFKWAHDLPVATQVDRETLGDWIAEKEDHWDRVELSDYQQLPLDGKLFDRFDNQAINDALNPHGYVYSGGLGRGGMPTFMLAELECCETAHNPEQGAFAEIQVLTAGAELARSMSAPPAVSTNGHIVVRRDALTRYIAAMVEEWSWKKEDNAMGRVVSHYHFAEDPQRALRSLVDAELENVILHELGERVAGSLIGDGWQEMIVATQTSSKDPVMELKARAIRDNLADCISSLPACLALQNWSSLDFYYANMTPLRRELFPAFCQAYRQSRSSGNFGSLGSIVASAREHWLGISKRLVSCVDANRLQADNPTRALNDCLDHCAY